MKANLKFDNYEACFQAIDTHTVGQFTRVVIDGFPNIEGRTMIEKKDFLVKHFDHYRKALMLEPKGHHDMFGSIVTEPINPEADYGIIFMDTGGYLNMCVHGSVGTATALIEGGIVEAKEPYTEIVFDAPAGLIRTKVEVKNGKAIAVTITNAPAFLYKEGIQIEVDGKTINCDISFGGSFFALVDAEQLGKKITKEDVPYYLDLGLKIREKINKTVEIKHPLLDINSVDLIEFYAHTDTPGCSLQNVVIFGAGQADRSPCGTGTCAKMAYLHKKGELALNEEFVYESVIGSRFYGKPISETTVGDYEAIIPQVTGSAYVCGVSTFVIDGDDPLKDGFLLG